MKRFKHRERNEIRKLCHIQGRILGNKKIHVGSFELTDRRFTLDRQVNRIPKVWPIVSKSVNRV